MSYKEIRKLIKIGDTSFGVILPRSWLRYHNLNLGDKVTVISNDFVEIKPLSKEEKELKRLGFIK